MHGTYRRNLESIRRTSATSVACMLCWKVELEEAVGRKMCRCVSDFLSRSGLIAGGGVSERNHIHFAPFEPHDGRVISGMRALEGSSWRVHSNRILSHVLGEREA